MECEWGQGTICVHEAAVLMVCGNYAGDVWNLFICQPHADDLVYGGVLGFNWFPCVLSTDRWGRILIDDCIFYSMATGETADIGTR